MTDPPRKVGVVATGGAYLGYAIVKVFEWLNRKNVFISYLGGTSIGAITGSALAGTKTLLEQKVGIDMVFRKWRKVREVGPQAIFPWGGVPKTLARSLWRLFLHKERIRSILDDSALRWLIDEFDPIKAVDPDGARFEFGLRDGLLKRSIIISNHDPAFSVRGGNPERLKELLGAAPRIPGLFDPESIDGRNYSDSIFTEFEPAVRYGCDVVFAVICHGDEAYSFLEDGDFFQNHPFISRFSPLLLLADYYMTHQVEWDRVALESAKRYAALHHPSTRIIPVYLRPGSESHTPFTFCPDDFELAGRETERQMETICKDIFL